jgi:hypothetical protein
MTGHNINLLHPQGKRTLHSLQGPRCYEIVLPRGGLETVVAQRVWQGTKYIPRTSPIFTITGRATTRCSGMVCKLFGLSS